MEFSTTLRGGDADGGTVFKLNKDGSGYAIMHSFTGLDGDAETGVVSARRLLDLRTHFRGPRFHAFDCAPDVHLACQPVKFAVAEAREIVSIDEPAASEAIFQESGKTSRPVMGLKQVQPRRFLKEAVLSSWFFSRDDMMKNPNSAMSDDAFPTRASLLERLKDLGDASSWNEFSQTYRELIYSVERRAGLNETESGEVVQDTLIAVAKKMPEFRYDPAVDSFKGWLLTLTRWRILDQLEKRKAAGSQSLHLVDGSNGGSVLATNSPER